MHNLLSANTSQNVKEELADYNGTVNEVWLDSMPENNFNYESSSSSSEPFRPMSPKEEKSKKKSRRIDLALSKMLIASSIPFEVIDSKHFFNFIQELNPNYRLPRSRDLKEKVLDGLTEKMMK